MSDAEQEPETWSRWAFGDYGCLVAMMAMAVLMAIAGVVILGKKNG
ncbi:MAG: hypothetical protein K8U57_35470 [Planctomycetes bacterium]|nr:hypothetical protein [Planctomycetota bacterium]